MRIGLLLLAAAVGLAFLRVQRFDGCELVGHAGHWQTPTLRVCDRCGKTWRREVEPIGATTTNQSYGW